MTDCISLAQWWGKNEPRFGDHNAIVAPDGYIYAYGGGPGGDEAGTNGSALFLTRVLQAKATDLGAYEYWNGVRYTSSRLYSPKATSVVMVNEQGTVMYSTFYQRFLYFAPGMLSTSNSSFT